MRLLKINTQGKRRHNHLSTYQLLKKNCIFGYAPIYIQADHTHRPIDESKKYQILTISVK